MLLVDENAKYLLLAESILIGWDSANQESPEVSFRGLMDALHPLLNPLSNHAIRHISKHPPPLPLYLHNTNHPLIT